MKEEKKSLEMQTTLCNKSNDFVKPTAEGRQFINRKSNHPKSTFKSILFGETIKIEAS